MDAVSLMSCICLECTKWSAEGLLDSLPMEAVGCAEELVEASVEVQDRAGQVSASLACEQRMPLHGESPQPQRLLGR